MSSGRKYVIWGSSGHAKVLSETIRRHNGQVVALFDNSPAATSCLQNTPLIGGINDFSDWIASRLDRRNLYGLVAVGGARGRERLALQQFLAEHGLNIEPLVHPHGFVADTATLGSGSQVLAMAVVAADVRIGAACIVNHKASVDHECQIADGVHLAPGATLCGCIKIEACTMIGANAIVLPRLHIGRDCIVGAGAVVTRDLPDGVVVAGNPAIIIRKSTN